MASLPLRFGLVGTGYWARTAHAPALASAEGVELAGVWGRNRQAALILHHQGGATSTVTVSQAAGEAAAEFEAFVWGGSGRSAAPAGASDPLPPLRTALGELVANVRLGRTEHPCDARFGRDVGGVIAEAQRQIDRRSRPADGP